MSGVEEKNSANAASNDPPGESPPDNPPFADGSDEPPPDNPPNPNGSAEPAPRNSPAPDGSDESAPGANSDGEPAPGNPPNPNGSAEPAPNANGSDESQPDNPPNPDGSGSGSSFEVIPDENNDNVVTVATRVVTIATRSSAPGRLETAKFRERPWFMGFIEVGGDGFPVGPYIGLAERLRLEELNNPPDPVRPRELSSSEEEISRPPSSDDDPNTVPDFPMDTP